jgi:anti-sigma-K factor RskA
MNELNPAGDSAAMTEEITAYLDGELSSADRRRVEDRLAKDAIYRAEMQRLERAWRMLDCLPSVAVADSFTRSTLAMVAVAASKEQEQAAATLPRRRRAWRMSVVVAVLIAVVTGVKLGRRLWPDPNTVLVRDLPLLEDFDLYRHADSVDFLRALDHDNVFGEETDHAG